jgi:hypothetical protein
MIVLEMFAPDRPEENPMKLRIDSGDHAVILQILLAVVFFIALAFLAR